MMRNLFSFSRYIILIAVLCAFIAAVTLLVLAGIETIHLVYSSFSQSVDGKSVKQLAFSFIEVIDLLLLATVFYITSLGLYELFIDEQLPTPSWLHIEDLDSLKSKLIGVVVIIMLVVFLGYLVNWDGQKQIFYIGASIAVVIAATTFFLGWQGRQK